MSSVILLNKCLLGSVSQPKKTAGRGLTFFNIFPLYLFRLRYATPSRITLGVNVPYSPEFI